MVSKARVTTQFVYPPTLSDNAHKVSFELKIEEYPSFELMIFLDPHFPDAVVEKVARTLLRQRLADLAAEAACDTFTDEELRELRQSVIPAS